MEYPTNITFKIEKDDLELDDNDNYEQFLFDVSVKVEKEGYTKEHSDWCIKGFESPGDLLEPLFFKQLTEPEVQKCAICNRYFSDGNSMLIHNISHLRVLIRKPVLFQCDYCSACFTDRLTIKHHITGHFRNTAKTDKQNKTGLTYMLTYKPKAYNPKTTELPFNSRYGKIYERKPKNVNIININNECRLKDGVTNTLNYKPKACKADKKKQSTVHHECHICGKVLVYRHWHAHMREVHGEGGYSCGLCNIQFKCERYFLRHMKKKHTNQSNGETNSKISKIPCDECDAVLNCKYALKTHKRNVHSGGEHVCSICKSKLKCRSYLLAHMRRVHYDDGKMHQCECGKKFISPRYLKVHKKNAHSRKK